MNSKIFRKLLQLYYYGVCRGARNPCSELLWLCAIQCKWRKLILEASLEVYSSRLEDRLMDNQVDNAYTGYSYPIRVIPWCSNLVKSSYYANNSTNPPVLRWGRKRRRRWWDILSRQTLQHNVKWSWSNHKWAINYVVWCNDDISSVVTIRSGTCCINTDKAGDKVW